MKSVKILAVLLALSVAGVASAATFTKGNVSVSTAATAKSYTCKQGTKCSFSSANAQQITSSGLVVSYYCATSKGAYSAPANVTVNVNGGNVYCTAFTFAGNGVGTSTAASSTSGSLGQLMCTLPTGGAAQTITTTNMDCSSNATPSALMTATNDNSIGWQ